MSKKSKPLSKNEIKNLIEKVGGPRGARDFLKGRKKIFNECIKTERGTVVLDARYVAPGGVWDE